MSDPQRDPRRAVDDFTPSHGSLAQLILARPDDDRPFLTAFDRVGGRRTWSTSAWKRHVRDIAGRLSAAGVDGHDTVAVASRSDGDTLATIFACWVLGAATAPVDALGGADEVRRTLSDLAPTVVLAAGTAEELLAHLGPVGCPRLSVSALPAATAAVETSAPAHLDDPVLVLHSSGTSGRSKGVVLSQRNLHVNADAMLHALAWTPRDTVLTVLPISHGNGLVIGSLMPWLAGAGMILCERFAADSFWAVAHAEDATTSSVVPTVMAALLERGGSAPPLFRDVVSGSGPLAPRLAADFEARFVPVRQLYGLSETTAVLTVTPRDGSRRADVDVSPGTSAGPAVPHAHVAVVDEDGRPRPEGVRGELVARGAMIMEHYLGMPEETRDALRDGWFHTGDQGAWKPGPDGQPWFTVTGRLKEIIVRGGLSISPLEIDAVLNEHPAVREALSFGYPDDYYGEEIAAFAVVDGSVSEAELIEFCMARLGRHRCPRRIVFGSEIPRTDNGKPRRIALAQRLTSPWASEG